MFGFREPSKPRVVAFVDFEHWYISLSKMFHIRPDIRAWRNELAKKYDIREIFVFADFSNQSLRAEIPKIREVTNYIIETQNASARVTKDFTDFIMLDHIYQKAIPSASSRALDTFIILSGDGHFSSVVSFLINQCGKKVGVYGVRGAISAQLKNTASWCVELPLDAPAPEKNPLYDMIFDQLKYLEDNNRGQQKMYPTFRSTIDAVASYNGRTRDQVADALRRLIELEYIDQYDERLNAKTVKVLRVNWDKVYRDRLYTPSGA